LLCRCSRTAPMCARKTMTGAAAGRYFRKTGSARATPCSGREMHTDAHTTPTRTHTRKESSTVMPTHTHNTHARMPHKHMQISYARTHTHERSHKCTRVYRHKCTRAYRHTHTHARTYSHTHTDTHSQAGTSTHKDMRMHARFSRTERCS
jgi:hypothetical protein